MKIAVFYDHVQNASKQSGESINECLEHAKAVGVDAIEFDYESLKPDDEYEELKGLLERNSLGVNEIYFNRDFTKDDCLKDAEDLINKAASLGCSTILVIPGFFSEEDSKIVESIKNSKDDIFEYMQAHAGIGAIVKNINTIIDMAKEKEIYITLEDYDYYTSVCSKTNELLYFMDRIPMLKFSFDTGNFAYSDEDALPAFDLFRKRIVHVHCKDRGEGLKSVPTGQGHMPIAQILNQLREDGFDGYLTMEHFGMDNQYDGIKESADFLSQFK